MMKNHTVIEGCWQDETERRSYVRVGLDIPLNAGILVRNHPLHPERFLLYGRTSDFSEFVVVHNYYFDRKIANPSKEIKGGWDAFSGIKGFSYIFDSRRSVIAGDGRVFVGADYFKEGMRNYLKMIPEVVVEAGKVFRYERRED